jgi:hypothetical protein
MYFEAFQILKAEEIASQLIESALAFPLFIEANPSN